MHATQPIYFDYLAAAEKANLSVDQIDQLEERWRKDYGSDEHLFELRMLRVCQAIAQGHCTFADALAEENEENPNMK